MLENIREKYRKMQVENEQKSIQTIRKNPRNWIIYMIVMTAAYVSLIVFFLIAGVYPLTIIAIVFAIWLVREMWMLFRKAVPKQKIHTNVKFNY